MDLSEIGLWTYWKLVHGPIRNQTVDLLETGLWTYWKPVHGPIGNQFVDLLETGLCPALKGFLSSNLTKSNKNL